MQPGHLGTIEEQLKNVEVTSKQLAKMIINGDKYKMVITHGNGPQIGNILLQNEAAKDIIPPMPLDVCGAESQGLIGYMIEQTLGNILSGEGGGDIPIVTIITQTIVNKNDPAFQNPAKPVGPFYTKEEAKHLQKERGYNIIEDAGRGYRRVVPSPDPIAINEGITIKQLVDLGTIVIAAGGGGVPVVKSEGKLKGAEAVIDKDLAAERLAEDIDAEILMFLTDVEQAMLNYGEPDEEGIDWMTITEAERYMKEGLFAEGSMKPKVEAGIRFIKAGGERAIITSLEKALEALEGKAGTTIS